MPYKDKEKRRGCNRRYSLEHKEELRQYNREYYQKYKEGFRVRVQESYQRNKEQTREQRNKRSRNTYRELKKGVLSYYSNSNEPVCLWCGEKDLVCLSIDHIDGGGGKHLREIGLGKGVFYRWLKKNNYPEGYQTLCMNCQFRKRGGEGMSKEHYVTLREYAIRESGLTEDEWVKVCRGGNSMNKWRPKGWKSPDTIDMLGYEAGADAMLEALFKLAEESPTKTFIIDSRVVNVFRQEEE